MEKKIVKGIQNVSPSPSDSGDLMKDNELALQEKSIFLE